MENMKQEAFSTMMREQFIKTSDHCVEDFLKGNFKLLSLGASKNLTFPSINIGLNIKNLQSLVEGNNSFCKNLITLVAKYLGVIVPFKSLISSCVPLT